MKRIIPGFLFLILAITAFASCSPISSEIESDDQSQKISTAAPEAVEPVDEPIIIFTDPLLEEMVLAATGKPEGHINDLEAEAVTYLNLNNQWHKELYPDKKIVNLQGLEYFRNLKSLDLSDHDISDIAVINNLTDLEELNLSGNPISDISPLSSLKSLKILVLSGCMAENYVPLSNLDKLEILVLDNASIIEASVLNPLKKLKQLYLAGSQVNNYISLAEIYPNLEVIDFTLERSLESLGFQLDNNQAIFESESASIRINHIEWGQANDEWMNNNVRTVFSSDNAKIDIGYYPNFDTYLMMTFADGEMILNYLYNHSDESFGFGHGDRNSSEETILELFPNEEVIDDILKIPFQIYENILAENFSMDAQSLFDLPFFETDVVSEAQNTYEIIGFTFLDYKGTYYYEKLSPHKFEISIHKSQWDGSAPEENRVDWNMEFIDYDVNGYQLRILYYEAEGKFNAHIKKDGAEAAFDFYPNSNEYGWENPDLQTAHRIFNDAFGTKEKEMYHWPTDYLESVLQEWFGIGFKELYALSD